MKERRPRAQKGLRSNPALPLFNYVAFFSLGGLNRRQTLMAPIAPKKSNFFARRNYDQAAPREPHQATLIQDQSAEVAADALLALTKQAIARIGQVDDSEPALRALWASLVEIKRLRAGDPGIRMAAQDVYEAAAAIAIHSRLGTSVVEMRRWRLLQQADSRLRRRLQDGANGSGGLG
jgi:hypothetical protein